MGEIARRPLRALILEDSPPDEALLVRELEKEWEVHSLCVDTEPALRKALEEPWDVVVSDWRMPSLTAIGAFHLVRAAQPEVPFVIVSGAVGEETAVEAMRAGVQDFLLKGSLVRLLPVIERELQEAVIRRERLKAQQQLAISDRLATVGTLAAGVAHEINNPLSAAISNVDSALRTVPALAEAIAGDPGGAEARRLDRVVRLLAEQRETLEEARVALARIRDTAQDLKLFSRTESEQKTVVDLNRVLDSAARMTSHATRQSATLVRDYGEIPGVLANESRLSQVFLNLIINAAQAIPEGRVSRNEIRLRTRFDPGTRRVVVQVTDTGTGIPPENLQRIFDPFFTTKPLGIGTGLGLPICHRIVTALDGTISVRSAPDRGSTFTVELPAAPAETAAARSGRPAPAAAGPARRARVLVIDDEPAVAHAIRRSMEAVHDVTALTSAQEALRRIDAGERFDVILCDLIMPEVPGYELYEQLEARVPDQARRMVFLSGGAFTQAARAFVDRRSITCLDKPFARDELLAAVNERI